MADCYAGQANTTANIISTRFQTKMLLPGAHHPRCTGAIMPQLKLYKSQMKSAYNFVPGVMGLILMLICAMMTSISLCAEKETGTWSPAGFSRSTAFHHSGKAVPYFVLSLST